MKSLRLVPPPVAKRAFNHCLWEAPASCGALALTFDDGPDPAVTPAVLDALDDAGAIGTFFMRGDRAEQYPDLVLQVRDRGHVIGSHSLTHTRMLFMRRQMTEQEIDRTQRIIAGITGTAPKYFRPPYGHFSSAVNRAVRDRGMSMVLWTALSGDFETNSPDTIYENVRPYIRPGAILVFHDTTAGGNTVLPGIIGRIAAYAAENNITLAGIDTLAAAWIEERN